MELPHACISLDVIISYYDNCCTACYMQTQLADEHAKMSELQDQLKDLQQRCDARAEVVKCINASPYWKTKEELEKLVQAQREHVFLTVS